MHPDVRVTGSLETPRARLRSWRFSLSTGWTGEEVTLQNHLLKMLFPISFFLIVFFLLFLYYLGSLFSVLFTYTPSEVWRRFVRWVQVKSVMGAESVGQCIEIKRYKVQFFLLAPTAVELMHIQIRSRTVKEKPTWSRLHIESLNTRWRWQLHEAMQQLLVARHCDPSETMKTFEINNKISKNTDFGLTIKCFIYLKQERGEKSIWNAHPQSQWGSSVK